MKKILLSCVLTALLTVVAPSTWAQPYNWKGTSDVSISSLKLDQNTETLASDKTILTSDLPVQRFDPDGVDRNVTLPAEASSTDLTFFIYNAANGAGEDLTIKNDTPATIVTLGPGMGMMFTCDGTNWVAIGDDGIVYDAQADTISFGSAEITTTGAANAATVNTGQGDNELYAMDQDVKTTDSPAFVTTDLTGVADGNLPYMQAAGAGFGDSPLSRTDADTLTFQSTTGKAAILNLYSDAAEDNSDKWRVQVADGGNVTLESYATGAWVAVATWTNAGGLTMTGNVAGATYGSDGSISDAELLKIDDGETTEIPVGGGVGSAMVWTTATGTGAPVRADSPTFTTQITTPKVLGGTSTTQDLDFQTTSGVGTTGADMHFKVGNNGATEAMTILNSGNVGIGTTTPATLLDQAQFSADAVGSYHTFSKSRNATAGSHTVVQDNDVIGGMNFAPSDGTDFGTISAQIKAEVDDASPAASSIGGALVFSTAAGAGVDDLTERMRIAANGAVSITGSTQTPYMPVLSKTADYVVTTSDFGKSIRFSHASTTGTMTLPSVGATNDGARITFVKTGVARLVIDAADSDLIHDSSAGGTIYSDSSYATITLEYVDGITAWVIISYVGTWTTT